MSRQNDNPKVLDRLSHYAGLLFALQFVGVILTSDFFLAMGLSHSQAATGLVLFAPTAIAVCVLMPAFVLERYTFGGFLGVWLLLFFTVLWFTVDAISSAHSFNQSDFDSKRPYFFFQGVFLCGLIGMGAALHWRKFVSAFLAWTFWLSLIECAMYLLMYRVDAQTGRFGGATALQHAIVFTVGLSCACAQLLIPESSKFRRRNPSRSTLWAAIIFLLVGVIVSGTRAALLGAVVSILLYVFFASNRGRLRSMVGVLISLSVLFFVVTDFVPGSSIERLSHIEAGGLSRRVELTDLAVVSFENHPFGKTREYDLALDGVSYVHNTLLQMLLEVGIVGVPILLAIIALAIRGALICLRSEPHLLGFMIVVINFILQSFSSGTGYTPGLWFSLFFLASIATHRVHNFGRNSSAAAIVHN